MIQSFFRFLLVFILIVGVAGYFAARTYGASYLKSVIETQGSSAISGEIKMSDLKVKSVIPLRVQASKLTVSMPEKKLKANVGTVDLSVSLMSSWLDLSHLRPNVIVMLRSPVIAMELPAENAAKKKAEPLPIQSISDLRKFSPRLTDLMLTLSCQDGQITLTKKSQTVFSASKLKTDLVMKSLDIPVEVYASLTLAPFLSQLPAPLPIEFKSQLGFKKFYALLDHTYLKVLNLTTNIDGYYSLDDGTVDLRLAATIPELSKIPLDMPDQPVRRWSGKMELKARVTKATPSALLTAKGSVFLEKFFASLDFKQPDVVAKGDVWIPFLSSDFNYETALQTTKSEWNVDLSRLQIEYKNLFRKPAQLVLKSSGEASLNNSIHLKKFNLAFDRITVASQGNLNLAGVSDISFKTNVFRLEGLEKFSPMLAQYPLKGEAEADGSLNGDLSKPDGLNVVLKSLRLDKVSGTVDYKTSDLHVAGPFELDLLASLEAHGSALKSGHVKLDANLSAMKVAYKDLFKKPAHQLLAVNLLASAKGSKLIMEKGRLALHPGTFDLSGELSYPLNQPLSLKVQSDRQDHSKWRQWLPKFASVIPNGETKLKASSHGILDLKDILRSSLVTEVDIASSIPEYTLQKSNAKSGGAAKEAAAEERPGALLEDSPLLTGLAIKAAVKVGEFNYAPVMTAKGAVVVAEIKNKVLSASGKVADVFSGQVLLKKVTVPLTTVFPKMNFEASFSNILAEKVLAAFLPEYKELASGASTGDVKGLTELPSSPSFMKSLEAEGHYTLKNGVLKTLQFENMAKEKLSSIPLVGKKIPIPKGPFQVQAKTEFKLAHEVITIPSFQAISSRNEELNIKGTVDTEMHANLNGTIFLVDAPVGGSFFEANKDSKNRLAVPVHLQGSLMKPDLDIAKETLKAMTQRTIDFEKGKAVAKVNAEVEKQKKAAQSQVNKVVDSKKKELETAAKDKLKDLFR